MIEKKEHYNNLLDVYGVLLTEHQKEICRCYYEEDLSLQEIAQNYQISRNAVFDNIKRVENLLEDYEKKLGLIKKENKENKKKILITIYLPLSEKENLLKVINNCQLFEQGNTLLCQIIVVNSKIGEVINIIESNLKNYQITISKIEKELKSR